MKKIFVLLLCAMVLFTACQPALPMEGSKEGSKEESKASAPSEEASSEKPAEPSEEPGETSEEPEEPKEPEETDLWIDAPTQAAQVRYDEDDRFAVVLSTVEEKQAFFEKYASFALYGGEVKLEDRYDAAYFENHRLLAAYTPVGSGSHRLGTESVWLKNGVLEWTFNEYSTGFGTCDMAGWVLLAEISRDVPVTAETPVELKGYDVIYAGDIADYGEDPAAMLLDDLAELQDFLSRYCREDFWHDYMGYDIERIDFEKKCFIGVYIPLGVASTKVSLKALTRTAEGVELWFGYEVPEIADLVCGGRVYLLQISKEHPAAQAESIAIRRETDPSKIPYQPEEVLDLQDAVPSWKSVMVSYSAFFTDRGRVFTDGKSLQEYFRFVDGKELADAIDSYGEDFFETHSLLYIFRQENGGSMSKIWREGLEIQPDGTVLVSISSQPGATDDVVGFVFFMEIPKEECPLNEYNLVKVQTLPYEQE